MQRIPQRVEHELRGLDDEHGEDATPLTLIAGVLVFVVPTLAIMMGAAFAAYFSF
jgi:hypothetical protein